MASLHKEAFSDDAYLAKPVDKKIMGGRSREPQTAGTSPHYPSCPECGSNRIWRDGIRYTQDKQVQRYLCRNCGFRFSKPERTQTIQTQFLKTMGNIHANCQVCAIQPKGAKNLATAENQTKTAVGASPEAIKGKIIEFLWQLEKNGLAKTTIKNYNAMLNCFLRNNIDLFNPEHVKEYIAKLPLKPTSKHTICERFAVWFKWLGINWQQPKYPMIFRIPFIPTEQEIDQLIAGCGKKTAAFLQLLKETGARSGEIANLTWTDIDFERRTVKITPEKGSLPRILPLSAKAIEMLKNLPKKNEKIFTPAHYMRIIFRQQRRKIAKKLGNPRLLQITFHTLRHWKATMEYHKTKDILYIKEILGHKNINNTQIYVHIEKALFQNAPPEEYHVKIAKTPEEITQLLEAGFEYVCQKDGLAFFRKRK